MLGGKSFEDWSAGMQDREQLVERVAELEAEVTELRSALRCLAGGALAALDYQSVLVGAEHGAPRSVVDVGV